MTKEEFLVIFFPGSYYSGIKRQSVSMRLRPLLENISYKELLCTSSRNDRC